MLMIVCVNVVVVSIALADAWKFLCAVIRLTNSSIISTFERSKEPENCSKTLRLLPHQLVQHQKQLSQNMLHYQFA